MDHKWGYHLNAKAWSDSEMQTVQSNKKLRSELEQRAMPLFQALRQPFKLMASEIFAPCADRRLEDYSDNPSLLYPTTMSLLDLIVNTQTLLNASLKEFWDELYANPNMDHSKKQAIIDLFDPAFDSETFVHPERQGRLALDHFRERYSLHRIYLAAAWAADYMAIDKRLDELGHDEKNRAYVKTVRTTSLFKDAIPGRKMRLTHSRRVGIFTGSKQSRTFFRSVFGSESIRRLKW